MTPFLKWLGGKARHIDTIHKHLPEPAEHMHRRFRVYEPFVGGGAVTLSLLDRLSAARPPVIRDLNPALILTWEAIRDDVEGVIDELEQLCRNMTKEAYELARADFNHAKKLIPDLIVRPSVVLAAYFVYLNKTGFNGMYRENKQGSFNVPWGQRENAGVYRASHLRAVSRALDDAGAIIECGPFQGVLPEIGSDSFMYLDPPFPPTAGKEGFTDYTPGGFNDMDQLELAVFLRSATTQGGKWMLSMPDQPYVRELYRGYNFHEIQARRANSATPEGRGVVSELLITNY